MGASVLLREEGAAWCWENSHQVGASVIPDPAAGEGGEQTGSY